ncbi:helix-turn-helix domain-containing protein [Tetragenococcus halophilus]|nr:helix-turn-helix domain-containing protein [Tetragenococcus halophilus]GBD64619.1 hypothetical protein TEHD23766T_2046 [Tetragenococcus halophilus subsp. flandriensis]
MKLVPKKRVEAVESYLSGKDSLNHIASTLGISNDTLRHWLTIYENEGPTGLLPKKKNAHYSIETKRQAVNDYLSGTGSLNDITKKYKLRSDKQLRDWIKVYNTHGNFKSGSGGSQMSQSRKTTFKERIEIVHYCILHDRNYGETAIKYQVSYQQVRNWVLKYDEMGEQGLKDRRGHRAGTKPSRTPEEEMRDRLAEKERRIQQLEMENDLLKKVRALERKWD